MSITALKQQQHVELFGNCRLQTLYTLIAVRNEPKPVLRYLSIRTRLSTHLNANCGHFKIRFFQKDKRILENNGSFPAANRVYAEEV